uniref:Rad51 domain-containing protein n=1 Tax=Angiostrongylus cantonensis TaxID=6313 RepID=A0A0K0CV48_ANGCA
MNETAVDTLVALGFPLAVLTGLDGVDDVLQNDLQYGDVSEISGNNGAGKTQAILFVMSLKDSLHMCLCYALVVNMLLSTEFGIVWIDSSGSFRSFRLMEYIHGRKEATDKDIMVLLDRLRVIRATDHVQLIEALKYAKEHMDEDNIRFIIIDNVHEMFDDRLIGENSGRKFSILWRSN